MSPFVAIAGYIAGLMFSFWPLLIFNALARRGDMLRVLLVSSGYWAVIRVGLELTPARGLPSFLIPEPLSTQLFFGMSTALVVMWLVRARGRWTPGG